MLLRRLRPTTRFAFVARTVTMVGVVSADTEQDALDMVIGRFVREHKMIPVSALAKEQGSI